MPQAKAKKKPESVPVVEDAPKLPGGGSLRLVYMLPEELTPHESNWRTHPPAQIGALSALLSEVGWAGALLYNERTGRLIDGHARRNLKIGSGEKVPVLVGDWSEEQEAKILATLDPIAGMAVADREKLNELLGGVQSENDLLSGLLSELKGQVQPSNVPIVPDNVTLEDRYEIHIICESEEHQRELLERFETEGLQCRALIA